MSVTLKASFNQCSRIHHWCSEILTEKRISIIFEIMKSADTHLVVILTFIFCLASILETANGDDCKAPKIIKRQIEKLYQCGKSMKFKDEHEKQAKMTCVLKCVLKEETILNQNGHIEKAMLDHYIESIAPKSMKTKAINLFNECRIEHEPNLDNLEEYCKSYDPLVKCFVWAAIQVFLDELIS